MANYATLKAAVADVVKTNGNAEITGANMQSTLLSIINSVGAGYQFMGVATPSTSAGTPDYNVFYIGGAGTYSNFGTSIIIPEGSICVFKFNGSWINEKIDFFAGVDDVPTAFSNNPVKSNGIYQELYNLIIYDGKFVNNAGTLTNDANWFVFEYKLNEPIKLGDVITWNGIESGAQKCIGFYLGSTFKNVRGATGDSRTFTIESSTDAAIGCNVIKASFLKSKSDIASVLINGVKIEPANTTKYTSVAEHEALISSPVVGIDLSQVALERGTIDTNGGDYSNNIAIRTPNNAKIEVNYGLILAKGYIDTAVAYVPNAKYIQMNIHCYDAYGASLGRTSSGWHRIDYSVGYVYELLAGTRYIRLSFDFHDGTQDIELTDAQVTSIIANVDSIISVDSYNDSLSLLRNDLRETQMEVDALPNQYGYLGAPINLKAGGCFDAAEFMTISVPTGSVTGQGCANWKEKLLVGGAGGRIRVFDMTTKTNLGDVLVASAHEDNHLNNICFGVEGDISNTDFPKYVYLSEISGQQTNLNRCFVENFSLNGSVLMQTISYENANNDYQGGFEWVVDTDNKYIYTIGLSTVRYDDNNAKIRVKKFKLPLIDDGSSVSLGEADVISSWEYDGTIQYMYIFQGACYYRGKIYLCTGGYDNGQHTMPHRIFVIDLLNGNVISVIDTAQVYETELEACCIYDNSLLACYTNHGKVYKFSF